MAIEQGGQSRYEIMPHGFGTSRPGSFHGLDSSRIFTVDNGMKYEIKVKLNGRRGEGILILQ